MAVTAYCLFFLVISSGWALESTSGSSFEIKEEELYKTIIEQKGSNHGAAERNQQRLSWLPFMIPVILLGLSIVVGTFGLRFVSTSTSGIHIGKSFIANSLQTSDEKLNHISNEDNNLNTLTYKVYEAFQKALSHFDI